MIRHLPRLIALMLTAGAAGLFPCRTSDAAQATLRCPATVQTGAQLATEVTVDVGMMPLGAYSVTVAYDPTVVRIASVEGGNTAEFAATPTTNADSIASGSAKISAFQTRSLTGPTGVVSVTQLTFNVGGTVATATALGLTVDQLFDTSANPISATATRCLVRVVGGTATSSTTTTTTSPSTTTTTLPGNTCPRGQGFWKNHPSGWPVSTLTLGSQTYTESELLAVSRTPPAQQSGTDASLILARQLIAAKLNIANGSDPTTIGTTVADADGLLATFGDKLPHGVRRFSALGQSMVSDADLLRRYNSGRHTPTCTHQSHEQRRQIRCPSDGCR